LLAVVLWVLLGAGCSSRSVRHTDLKREGPVVILGDSLSSPYELPAEQGFVAILSQRLGTSIVNLSRNGMTTEQSLGRVKEEVLPLKPCLVMLELGGNDALQKVERARVRENLASMIKEMQQEGIPVVLLGVRGGLFSDGYEGMYESLAEEYATGLVPDILEGVFGNPELKLDHIHPNAKGHLKMADRIEPELRRVWEKVKVDS
jgi:acyl-CoA thioesterase-1